MKQVRIVLWVAIAIVLAGLAWVAMRPQHAPQRTQESTVPSSFGGPFTLVGDDGKQFSSSRLDGKPYVLFFGFTHCPDTCPTTLARLVKLRRDLGKGDRGFDIVFVTVDPERDGPREMGSYAKAFGAPIIGLTGSPAQIATVKKQFGIFSQKVPDESGDGDYSVDHTATVLLFGRDGKFVATIAPDEQDQPALAKLKRITAG